MTAKQDKPDKTQRRPRIRKAPISKREQLEAKSAAMPDPRRKRAVHAAAKPLKKLKLPKNRATLPLFILGRFVKKVLRKIIPRYFVDSWHEVRQVTWPGRRETWRLTFAVFVFALVFGLLASGTDKILDEVFKRTILK